VTVYSFGVAFIIGWIIEKTMGFRAATEVEVDGIDIAEHAESAYELTSGTGGSGAFAMAGIGSSSGAATEPSAAETPVRETVSS
jgi:Amt family ammonium transporter